MSGAGPVHCSAAAADSMASFFVHDRMFLLAADERADWITLDGGGILFILVTVVLAAGLAVSGVALAAAASFSQPAPSRARRAQQAVLCFALAALVGFGLPVLYDTMRRETQDALGSWALVWAPALATVGGLLVRRTGRPG